MHAVELPAEDNSDDQDDGDDGNDDDDDDRDAELELLHEIFAPFVPDAAAYILYISIKLPPPPPLAIQSYR